MSSIRFGTLVFLPSAIQAAGRNAGIFRNETQILNNSDPTIQALHQKHLDVVVSASRYGNFKMEILSQPRRKPVQKAVRKIKVLDKTRPYFSIPGELNKLLMKLVFKQLDGR